MPDLHGSAQATEIHMTDHTTPRHLHRILCGVVIMAQASSLLAAPAQGPLLTASAGPKPNVVLTLDDSGSMNYFTMPESADIRMHPNDPLGSGNLVNTAPDSALTAKKRRSPDFNGVYYNPNIVYKPWPASVRNIPSNRIDDDGYPTDMTQVPVYPGGDDGSESSAVVNLAAALQICTSNCGRRDETTITFNPAVYFRLTAGRSGENVSDFTRHDVNSSTDFPNATERAFQQKNFRTWFTYYRTRLLMAKGATALAFDAQNPSQFRLGYGRINARRVVDRRGDVSYQTSAVDDYSSAFALQEGVRTFDATRKSTFFTWLQRMTADGGTPLRRSMQDIGNYYSTASPYRTDPSSSTGPELSCRRNYHILVTDGYWNVDTDNDISNAIGNADKDSGSTFTSATLKGPDGTTPFSYQYTQRAPYKDSSGSASKTLADIAMHYWKNDLRPNLTNNIPVTAEAIAAPHNKDNNPAFWQHMVNFTVSLGVTGTVAPNETITASTFGWPTPIPQNTLPAPTTIDDLWHAAVNSRGRYLSAKNPSEFATSLSSILSSITSTGGTVSGVAVSRSTLASNTSKFVPSFEPNKWSGELKSVLLSSTTGTETSVNWNASRQVPAHNLRNLWMGTATGAAEFRATNLSGTTPLGHIRSSSATQGVAPTVNDALVNYLRGDNTGEGPDGFRPRQTNTYTQGSTTVTQTNVLGDMLNSVPLYVKGANFGNRFLPATVNSKPTGSGTYNAFLATKNARSGLVLIGANDGMLHGFRATDGIELFGYIPQTILRGDSHPNSTISDTASNLFGLARLADPNYEHQLYVDGQLTEADVCKVTGDSCTWKNIVVASTGGGAKSVFALDITSNFSTPGTSAPDSVLFNANNKLWEYGPADNDLGYVVSAPEIGMLPSGRWAAFFGNGYDSNSGKAVLFIVDAVTGELIKKIAASSDTGNGLGGVRLVRDLNNIVRAAYAGDLLGNVWKFNRTETDPLDWGVDFGGSPLINVAQPIMATPNYTLHPTKGLIVVVPTGKLYSTEDKSSTGQQTIYGLWDKAPIGSISNSSAVISLAQLNTKTATTTGGTANTFRIVNGSNATGEQRGWRLSMLQADGERGIYMPQFIGNYTYVESVKPSSLSTESCDIAQGSGYGYLIDTVTGQEPASPILDITGDGNINTSDAFGVFKRNDIGRSVVLPGPVGSRGSVVGSGTTGAPSLPENLEVNHFWRQIFWTIR